MKVLIICMYHPELVRGGSQQVAYELFQGLRQVPDVEPVLLASITGMSPTLYKSGARITGFDGRPDEYVFLSQEYDYPWQKSGNVQLAEAFADFLALINPDVVHFHHFMTLGIDYLTLTRTVLPSAKIVFTAHEFLTICVADGHMRRFTDQSLCTSASAVRCNQCRPERPPEHYFMREMWMKRHLEAVDVFTTPSRFMVEPFVNWGLPREKFMQVANGLDPRRTPALAAPARTHRNRFGFFGQLVDAKGVQVILDAVTLLRAEGFTDFSVEINGGNIQFATPECRAGIEAFLAAEAALPPLERNVVLNGGYHPDQLQALMARIDWCLVPSLWWEIFCLVISEAWSFGRPVIASNVGGPAERITNGVDGLLFELGDARALAEIMRRAATEEGLWERLAAEITPPASRAAMAAGFLDVYRAPAGAASAAAAG
jgi:glycosyltransferase involved in cell wall biosynthesis